MTTRKLKSKSRKQSRKITRRKLTRKYNKIQNGGDKTYEDFMKVTDLCQVHGTKLNSLYSDNKDEYHMNKSGALTTIYNGTNKLAKDLLEKIKTKYYGSENIEGSTAHNKTDIVYKKIPLRVATALYRIYRYNDFIPSFALFGSRKTIKDKIMKVYNEELNFINEIIKDEKQPISINCDYKNETTHELKIPASYSKTRTMFEY